MDKNYKYYMQLDVAPYVGKWLAIVDGNLVSVKDDLKEVLADSKKQFPHKRPLITKIPSKKVRIL